MNTKIDTRLLTAAVVGAALALSASAILPRFPGASVALAADQPQDGKPGSGLLTPTEVLLRLERQMEATNASLAEIKAQLNSGVPVRIIEPLPAGLRSPAVESKPPATPKLADPQSSEPGHPAVHPSEPKSPTPGSPR